MRMRAGWPLGRLGMDARRFVLPDTRRCALALATLAQQALEQRRELSHARLRHTERLGRRAP